MATKLVKSAMNGAHTAGIYADMSVDGPEIGTLVVIIDRAKNLPNRKTMGKQDPYCAARLGKEAKKTETDRRGGQTPKWDQELRFTVHDSLDYHQLKVSVFNDDKKTDLIGETWVSLDPVLTPGGGKNDMWHSLNCRGRYAGEIRIELTYYDSRPREERSDEAIGSTPPPRSERGTPNGSRQQKPVKRRPLPANPTQSTANLIPSRGPRPLPGTSADSSFTPSMFRAQEQVNFSSQALSTYGDHEAPENSADDQSTALDRTYQTEQREIEAMNNSAIDSVHDLRGRDPYAAEAYENIPYHSTLQNIQTQDHGFESPSDGLQLPELPPHTPRTNRPSAAQTPKYYTPANSSPSFTLPQYERAPEQQQQGIRDAKQPYQNSQPYHSSPLRSQSMDVPYEDQQVEPYHEESRHLSLEYSPQDRDHDAYDIHHEPTLPPLPPPHTRASAIHTDARDSRPHSLPAPVPVRPTRSTVSGSPLSQIPMDHHPSNQFNPAPPSEYASSTISFPLPSNNNRTYDPRITPNRQRNDSRTQANNELFIHDTQSHISHARSYPNMPQTDNDYAPDEYNGFRSQQTRNHARSQYGSDYDMRSTYENRAPRQPQYQNPSPGNQYVPQPTHPAHASVGRPHRASAPVIPRRGVSPDPRTPSRKSVSPHPDSASRDSRMISVPFSPDSYEQLNPNLSAAKSINVPNPKYNTPESIREAAQDFAKEEKLRTGPIVNSAGKVVDPSDHLPSDTWAPEPERKTPRKSHQINVKFRHHQSGTQSLPTSGQRLPAREPMARPPVQPMPPVMHTQSAEDVLPVSTGRNRLQKRNGPAPVHFNSSPAVPMSHATPPSQALRENPNYGYTNSPSYGRGHQNRPPPIPAKVPLGGGQEDWGPYDMSDDFSTIDLGPGPGARSRRTQLR